MTHPYSPLGEFEKLAFQTLNAVVEPLVRAGLGGPLLTPFGAIVLEVPGRKSGEIRRTPLLATTLGGIAIVATYRGRRSEWVKNLATAGFASWWLNGARHSGRPLVFAPGAQWPAEEAIPPQLRSCAESTWRALVGAGWAVALLLESSDQP